RCLKKNREERFATADELRDALDLQLEAATTAPYTSRTTAKESPARRRGVRMFDLAYILLFLAMGAVGLGYWMTHRKEAPAPQPIKPITPPASTVNVTAPPAVIPSVSEGPGGAGGAQPMPQP